MPVELELILERIRSRANREDFRLTQHAVQEMAEDSYSLDDVLFALNIGTIIEHYPEHRRGACCLINGATSQGRPLHVVCTTAETVLIIITVYEPLPPRWPTPVQRGRNE
ncbi:MAG: DUF4258 domain-containing protein [Thermomicrobiales bacterium]|nr:DUF4258 domain-containing protein [Thermomicrobiales bacterium]